MPYTPLYHTYPIVSHHQQLQPPVPPPTLKWRPSSSNISASSATSSACSASLWAGVHTTNISTCRWGGVGWDGGESTPVPPHASQALPQGLVLAACHLPGGNMAPGALFSLPSSSRGGLGPRGRDFPAFQLPAGGAGHVASPCCTGAPGPPRPLPSPRQPSPAPGPWFSRLPGGKGPRGTVLASPC